MKKIINLLTFLLAFAYANAQTPNEKQTKEIFNFLFGEGKADNFVITEQDKEKAQLFLKELIEKSCLMSLTEGLAKSSFPPSFTSVAKSIIETYQIKCNEAVKQDGRYYESVKNTLSLKWKSAFAIRKDAGEWM